jgi:hypothetical protein
MESNIKCSQCQHWKRLSEVYYDINTSKFGRCSNPKIFGWDYMESENGIDAQLTSGDEVVITEEYCTKPTELENTKITTGENFGCIHFKQHI